MSVVTEREWRKRAARAARPARCWGAQCVHQKRPLTQDRAFHALMLLVSLAASLMLPLLAPVPARPAEYPVAETVSATARLNVRVVSDIEYLYPAELAQHPHTYTREQLLRGKLLLIDAAHPLPFGVPAPNTLSVATYGKGMVPVGDLGVKCGREAIDALARLFAYARGRGIGGLIVSRAAMSPAEQSEHRFATLRALCAELGLDAAVARTLSETDAPYTGELQQEYTVELRLQPSGASAPDERPLGQTQQGRFLTQNAWRFGFIHREPEGIGARRFRFRYVGEAHATAMQYLDLNLEEYLTLLHEKRVVTVKKDGAPRFVILCAPMGESHIEFLLPEGAACDASLDNTGWAVVACALP